MRGWEGSIGDVGKVMDNGIKHKVARFGIWLGEMVGNVCWLLAWAFIGAIFLGVMWGLYQITQLTMVPIMGKWAYGLWGVIIFIGAIWGFINWANKYSEWQKEVNAVKENEEALERLESLREANLSNLRLREEYNRRQEIIERSESGARMIPLPYHQERARELMINESNGEAEVDVINPLTPEIRCSNCRHSSDNRGSLVGSAIDCNTCHNHSLFIHIPEIAQYVPEESGVIRSANGRIITRGVDGVDGANGESYGTLINRLDIEGLIRDIGDIRAIPSSNTVHTEAEGTISPNISINPPYAPNTPDMFLKAPQMPLELINKVKVGNAIDGLEI